MQILQHHERIWHRAAHLLVPLRLPAARPEALQGVGRDTGRQAPQLVPEDTVLRVQEPPRVWLHCDRRVSIILALTPHAGTHRPLPSLPKVGKTQKDELWSKMFKKNSISVGT